MPTKVSVPAEGRSDVDMSADKKKSRPSEFSHEEWCGVFADAGLVTVLLLQAVHGNGHAVQPLAPLL